MSVPLDGDGSVSGDVPRWVLAVGPLVVLAVIVLLSVLTSPLGSLRATSDATTLDVLWALTVVGAVAGILPVAIGMLWFPFIRSLHHRYVHSFVALSAGVLAFIGFEMVVEILAYGRDVDIGSSSVLGPGAGVSGPVVVTAVVVAGVGGTFAATSLLSEWRRGTAADREKSGLEVAYLVAVALGLHSLGEGLAIGTAFVLGKESLVTLLIVGFFMHNVMEGPIVVSAVARDAATPPLGHFAVMGAIAGGTVIVGGWVGSLTSSDLVAVLCYAVAVGAVLQVLVELADLIRFDAEALVTRLNAATFAAGVGLMYLLEGVVVEGLLVH